MATFTFFDDYKRYVHEGLVNVTSDTFIMYLTNNAPNVATNSGDADLAAITSENGYTPTTLTVSWSETGAGTGVWRLANDADVSWTASGGSFGPFRYVVVYDDTTTVPADLLVGFFDVGSATTITDGNAFTVDLDANFELFTSDG